MDHKIIDSIWFTPQGKAIGIVIIQTNVTKVYKAYIGVASGFNEKDDIDIIAEHGSPFPLDAATTLIGRVLP